MPSKCCVPFCSSTKETKISFHEFPSNSARRYEWLKAISRDNFTPSECSKVCGYHFQESDFTRLNKPARLKENAVPTIFKGYPTFMTDQESSDLKHKETVNKSYASGKSLLKVSNSLSHEFQALLNPERGKQLGSKVELLNHSSVDKTITSVLNTEDFVSESALTQIKDKSTSSIQLDKTSSSNEVNLQIGAQHNINITESDFPNKKFYPFDSNRLSALKTYGTSTIKNNDCDHINTGFTSKKMKISLLPKKEAVKLLSQSNCSLKTTRMVSLLGKQKSGESNASISSIHHTDFLKKNKKKDTDLNLINLRRKIRGLQSQVCKKNKKIQSLKAKMEEMSEKLEYFENDTVLQNVEKMKVIDKEGLATTQMKFILSQISNLDRKNPRWSEEVIRECVLLHASSPKAYEALLKAEFFKLPKRGTLMRFASFANSQTRNNLDSELESELATEIINCEPEFDGVVNEISSDHSSGNMEEDYFNYY